MRKEMFYQSRDDSCSLAVLKMLMADASGEPNYQYMKPERPAPYSLEDVERIAQKEGFKIEFRKVDDKEDIRENTQFPLFIVFEEEGIVHSVKLERIKFGLAKIADPACGIKYMSLKKFMSLWNGVYGILTKENDEPCPYMKTDVVPKKNIGILSLIEIAAVSTILVGLYFVDENGNYLIPLICFALYAIAEILRRGLSLRFMKDFDDKWLEKVCSCEDKRTAWSRYHSLEKNMFSSVLNLISSAVSCAAIILVGGLNEPSFFIAGALCLLVVAAKKTFDDKNQGYLARLSVAKERDIFSSNEIEKARELKELSYRYGSYVSYSQIISTFVILCISLVPVFHSGQISLNYFLFQFIGLYVFAISFGRVLSFDNETISKKKDLMYFYEYIS